MAYTPNGDFYLSGRMIHALFMGLLCLCLAGLAWGIMTGGFMLG